MELEDTDVIEIEDRGPGDEVDRVDTLLRILYSVLFALGLGVLESLIYLLVAVQLGWSLVTGAQPPDRLAEIANRLLAFYYRVLRWMTHNQIERPFPFSDFPAPVEPPLLTEDADL